MTAGARRWRWRVLLGAVVVALHALGLAWLHAHLSPPVSPMGSALRLVVRDVAAPPLPAMTVPRVAVPPPKAPASATRAAAPTALPVTLPVHRARQTPDDPPAMVAATAVTSATAAAPAAPGPSAARAPRSDLQVPAPARWRYQLRLSTHGIELSGQAELTWRHDGRTYEAQLELRAPPAPTRIQRSTGRLGAEGLEPLRFSERRRNEQATHFDRERKRIVFSSNQPEAELAAGAQDRLSVLLQLGALLEPSRRPLPEIIELQVAGTQDAEVWRFRYEGDETLDLPGGPQRTHRLVRLPRKDFDQKVELWLAPGLADAPVRLRLTSPNGEWLDQQWSGTDRP